MKHILRIIYVWIFTIHFANFVQAESYLHTIQTKASASGLASNKGWLSLLHYRKSIFFTTYISEASKSHFFLHKDGKHDPEKELRATLVAIFKTTSLDDSHIQCRFPARFQWLVSKLSINRGKLPKVTCNKLQKWKLEMNTDKVSLIFPSAYLGSASSMFGHLFLRFDNTNSNNYLLSKTINYAALISRENTSSNYFGGVFTGLPAIFSIKPYYLKLQEYSFIENRDIWEYELDLSKNEVELLLLHIWEIKDNPFDYFFISENCAYRMLAILEAAKPELGIVRQFQISAIPTEIISGLHKAGAINSFNHRPSAKNKFHNHVQNASETEKMLVRDIVYNRLTLQDLAYTKISKERKPIVLALAAEYLSLLISEDKLDRSKSHKLLYLLIKEQDKYQTNTLFDPVEPDTISPHYGHAAEKISIQRIKSENHQTAINYRYAYHNLLDPQPAYSKGNHIETMNFNIRIADENVKLHELHFFDIRSYSPVSDFFSPTSWNFSTGLARNIVNHNELGFYAKTGSGKTYKLGNMYLYGLIRLSFLQGRHYERDYAIGVGLQAGSLFYFNRQTLRAHIETTEYLYGEEFNELIASLEYSLSLHRNSSLSLHFKQSQIAKFSNNESIIQYNYFF